MDGKGEEEGEVTAAARAQCLIWAVAAARAVFLLLVLRVASLFLHAISLNLLFLFEDVLILCFYLECLQSQWNSP